MSFLAQEKNISKLKNRNMKFCKAKKTLSWKSLEKRNAPGYFIITTGNDHCSLNQKKKKILPFYNDMMINNFLIANSNDIVILSFSYPFCQLLL